MIARKDDFYDSLINVLRKLGEKEIVVTAGDFNATLEVTQKSMRTKMEVLVMELETKKAEGFLFRAVMKMTVGNTVFKNEASHLVICEPGPPKPQVDYCLVRRKQRKLLKDIKVLPSKEYKKPSSNKSHW